MNFFLNFLSNKFLKGFKYYLIVNIHDMNINAIAQNKRSAPLFKLINLKNMSIHSQETSQCKRWIIKSNFV
jgi:hypothetical protein